MLPLDIDRIREAPWTPVPPPITGPAPVTVVSVEPAGEDLDLLMGALAILDRRCARGARLAVVSSSPRGAVTERAAANRLMDRIHVVDPADRAALYGWYRAATALVCVGSGAAPARAFSEAMALDVPIVSLDTPDARAVLDGAGTLVAERAPEHFAWIVSALSEDRAFRRAVLETQERRFRQNRLAAVSGPRPRIQIEGPFETSYSLAIVNRELALALERQAPGSVALFATEGPGDFQPDQRAIGQFKGLEDVWRRGCKGALPEVLVRLLYPPRVADMDGRFNILYWAWEESSVPPAWVEGFNAHLDGLCVLSLFVKKVLIDSGVSVPITVGGCGIDQIHRHDPERFQGDLGRKFRFLHISSAFPRKGVDVLLRAYTSQFTGDDDVTLVLKTFPNPHNRAREMVEAARANPRCPDVRLIDEDLPPGQLIDLYRRCHAFVAPSRGEGFGLPLAEAMHLELPVIATAHGGHREFCTPQTAWLIDYRFAAARTHFGQSNSVWAEPDAAHLGKLMRHVLEHPLEARAKARRAKERVDRTLAWEQCAGRLQRTVEQLRQIPPLRDRRLRIGWVSSWNTRCGVASYSRFLLDRISREADTYVFANRVSDLTRPDEPNVLRCWSNGEATLNELEAALRQRSLDVVVIQFAFGFFKLEPFRELLERLRQEGIAVVAVFHRTAEVTEAGYEAALSEIADQLRRVDRLLVHSVADLNRLKELGLVDNVALLPQGVLWRLGRDKGAVRDALGLPREAKIVATYGFLLPPKGIEEMVDAFPAISREHPEALLLLVNSLYPIAASAQLRDRVWARVRGLSLDDRVVLIEEYLRDEESLALLEAADVVVFPYQRTNESSSAAVRFGLASRRPVACTPLEIFAEVSAVVHTLPGTEPPALAAGLCGLLRDRDRLEANASRQAEWLSTHDWGTIAARLLGMMRALVRELESGAMEGPSQSRSAHV